MRTLSLALTVVLSLRAIPLLAQEQSSGVQIITSSPDRLVLEFRCPEPSIEDLPVVGADQPWQLIRLPGCHQEVQEGAPLVPSWSVNIGLPPRGDFDLVVLEDEFTDREGLLLAPGPAIDRAPGDEFGHYQEIYRADSRIYSRAEFYPSNICRARPPAMLRQQRVLPLEVFAVQFHPVTQMVRIHHRIVVQVRFSPAGDIDRPQPAADAFEEIYRWALVNYQQARAWRLGTELLREKGLTDENPFSTSSDWFKISIRKEGICRLTASQLEQAGVAVGSVDPATIKIYNIGHKILPRETGSPPIMAEIPIRIIGQDDGRLDPEDQILFYATDLTGWEWMTQGDYYDLYANPYTSINAYWLTYGGDIGRRWESRWGAPMTSSAIQAERFREVAHEERDFLNPDYSGLTWYWDSMTGHSTETSTYRVTLSDVAAGSCLLRARAKGIYYRPEGSVPSSIPHHLYIYLNDNPHPSIERFWYGALVIEAEEQTDGLQEGENVIQIVLPRAESEWDHILFDWLEIEYWRGYGVVSDQLHFPSPETAGTIQYDLAPFSQSTLTLLDITNPWAPVEITGGSVLAQGEGYLLRFQDNLSGGQQRRYYASAPQAYLNPLSIERRIPADLRQGGADVIMVTPRIFREYLEPLADLHRQEGLSIQVTNIEDIYDQFAWGLEDPTALRDYLWYLYYAGQSPLPAYVLLFGDGNFDYQNNSGAGGHNWIPPYENGDLSTDDWFVRLDGDYLADMMIGRLPARSSEEAEVMVSKIVDYVRNPLFGPWRNRVMIVSDDETADRGEGNELFHVQDSEDLARQYIPPNYDQHKVYLMEYPMNWQNKKPQSEQAVIDGFNEGMLVINWIGHGNFDVWAHEDAFRGSNDIPKLANDRQLPLVYSASCDVGRFDHTLNESMCEEFLRARGKGAVATIGAIRSCFATPNAELNKEVLHLVLGDGRLTLGQGLFGAKLGRPNSYSNDQKYALFGDPCMRLGRPELDSRIVSLSSDTLRALDHITVVGQVGRDGVADTLFSGTVALQAFDSARPTSYTTAQGSQAHYLLPGAPVFRGTSLVEGGRFEVTFVMPKDISYGGRLARISAYLHDAQDDGLAYRDSLLVGGTVTAVEDTVGPSINISIAGQNFVSGDFTSSSPTIVVRLEDENGINITGEVGHWIVMIVDENVQLINITDRFSYDPGSYQRGMLEYTIAGLSPGSHGVTVKAWDNFNNFSTGTLTFQVAEEAGLVLQDVLNCPNPFDPGLEQTVFTYQLSRPAEVVIKIYTVAGRLIRTLKEGQRMSGYNQSQPWEGQDEDGDSIANGVYLYKITARADGKRAEAHGKVVIMR